MKLLLKMANQQISLIICVVSAQWPPPPSFFPSVCGRRHRPIFFCASVFLFTSHFSSLHFTCSLLSFFSSMFSFVYPLPLRCLYFSFSPCSPPLPIFVTVSEAMCREGQRWRGGGTVEAKTAETNWTRRREKWGEMVGEIESEGRERWRGKVSICHWN